jgi:hypothetical protein
MSGRKFLRFTCRRYCRRDESAVSYFIFGEWPAKLQRDTGVKPRVVSPAYPFTSSCQADTASLGRRTESLSRAYREGMKTPSVRCRG